MSKMEEFWSMARKMPRSRMTVSVMRATIMTWLSVASRLMRPLKMLVATAEPEMSR